MRQIPKKVLRMLPKPLLSLISWMGMPVYIVQGIWVRVKSIRMPSASGPVVGRKNGSKDAVLRLLVIGDSTAAGVGCETIDEALPGQLAAKLSQQTGKSVEYRFAGANSATADDLRDNVVPNIARVDYEHVIISVGTNDIKNIHTVKRWKKGFGGLLYATHSRFPTAKIWWVPVVSLKMVPALPEPMASLIEMRAKLFVAKGKQLCFERSAHMISRMEIDGSGFAADQFHPGPIACEHWAAHVIEEILAEEK